MTDTHYENRIRLTYQNLRAILDANAWADDSGKREVRLTVRHGEGEVATLIQGELMIHDHPSSGRPREIHVMCSDEKGGWQKIAEIGPPDGREGVDSDVAPGYISLTAEWDGRPVGHIAWQNLIRADNGLLPSERESIDELAASVIAALHDLDINPAVMSPTLMRSALGSARDLARAVVEAHAIHPSYEAALEALGTERVAKAIGQFEAGKQYVRDERAEGEIDSDEEETYLGIIESLMPRRSAAPEEWETALDRLRDRAVEECHEGEICESALRGFLQAAGLPDYDFDSDYDNE
jgi:hypothetical protein